MRSWEMVDYVFDQKLISYKLHIICENVNSHFPIKTGDENKESNYQNCFHCAKNFGTLKNGNAEKVAVDVSHFE